mgnify:CR=1 FL=1
MPLPMPRVLKWPGIEHLDCELYVERYLLQVEGVELLLISTRRDVYWPMRSPPTEATSHRLGEPDDGFTLGDVWYQSVRQIQRAKGEQDDDEIEQFILDLVCALETGGVNLNRQAH